MNRIKSSAPAITRLIERRYAAYYGLYSGLLADKRQRSGRKVTYIAAVKSMKTTRQSGQSKQALKCNVGEGMSHGGEHLQPASTKKGDLRRP